MTLNLRDHCATNDGVKMQIDDETARRVEGTLTTRLMLPTVLGVLQAATQGWLQGIMWALAFVGLTKIAALFIVALAAEKRVSELAEPWENSRVLRRCTISRWTIFVAMAALSIVSAMPLVRL